MFPSSLHESPAQQSVEPARQPSHPLSHAMKPFGGMLSGRSEAEQSTSITSSAVVDQMVFIQKSITEMRKSQDELERSLRGFIKQELQHLQTSLTEVGEEVHMFKVECLGTHKQIMNAVEHSEGRLDDIHSNVQQTVQKLGSHRAADSSVREVDIDNLSNGNFQGKERIEGKQVHKGENEVEDEVLRAGDGEVPQLASGSPSPILTGTISKKWDEFQEEVEDFDPNTVYRAVLEAMMAKEGVWHHIFAYFGKEHLLRTSIPQSCAARATEHWLFLCFQTLLITTNTGIMGYETDVAIKAALQTPDRKSVV